MPRYQKNVRFEITPGKDPLRAYAPREFKNFRIMTVRHPRKSPMRVNNRIYDDLKFTYKSPLGKTANSAQRANANDIRGSSRSAEVHTRAEGARPSGPLGTRNSVHDPSGTRNSVHDPSGTRNSVHDPSGTRNSVHNPSYPR
jgi:hypothetical protein